MSYSMEEFFSVIVGAKEPSIMLAKNDDERTRFAKALYDRGFAQSKTVGDLFQLSRTFLIITDGLDKTVYDFLVQYPTGQVQIFNKATMQSQTMSPNYAQSSIVIIVNNETVRFLADQGVDLRAITGLAYQS